MAALIIQFERDLFDDDGVKYQGTITFTREQLEDLLKIPDPPIQGDTGGEYRCKVCGVPMQESFSEGRYVNEHLETDRWEEYHGIVAMNGYPNHCIIYNDVFGWNTHEPEEV